MAELYTLGTMGFVDGFVYDIGNHDLIVVGRPDPQSRPFCLDDLVTALRARLRLREWPVVSIDPLPETSRTRLQRVRYEGGIAHTGFGRTLFNADFDLKQMAMGLLDIGIPGIQSYWDRYEDQALGNGNSPAIQSRFWFYPVCPQVRIRDGVCVIRGLKVGVFTEVLSGTIGGNRIEDPRTFVFAAADSFANVVSRRFDDLSLVHPSFRHLKTLQTLVALSNALENLDPQPNLAWWLDDYPMQPEATPDTCRLLRREEGSILAEGWVLLTALALRVSSGDVRGLRDAVLLTRPSLSAISWRFIAAGWLIPIVADAVPSEDISLLFQQATFLDNQRRYAEAVALYDELLRLEPESGQVWWQRGLALGNGLKQWDKAIESQEKAHELLPRSPSPLLGKGDALVGLNRWDDAIACFDTVIAMDTGEPVGWIDKAIALRELGRAEDAVRCLDHVLGLQCSDHTQKTKADCVAWFQKGLVCAETLGDYGAALTCFDEALQRDPGSASCLGNKGAALAALERYSDALPYLERAVSIDPSLAFAWVTMAAVLGHLGRFDEALASANHAIEVDTREPLGWRNKGMALFTLGRDSEARTALREAMRLGDEFSRDMLRDRLGGR